MKRFVLPLLVFLFVLPTSSWSLPPIPPVELDANCDQAAYYSLGTFCQDTDDGVLYKGTGAAVEIVCGPAPVVNCSAGCTTEVTAAKAKCGAVITNYGQGAADRNVTLPAAAASMSIRVDIGTTQAANYFRLTSAEGNNMDLDDVSTGKDYIQYAAPTAKDGLSCFTIQTGASSFTWLCYTRKGIPTGGDL